MKSLPTVVVSRDAATSLYLTEFNGVSRVPNRDAVGYYFRGQDQSGSTIRLGVIFSGTVLAVDLGAFGLPVAENRDESFRVFSLAAIGDYLDESGQPSSTPSNSPAHHIECFSPHFQDWADRQSAGDREVEQYIHNHLYEAWRSDLESWEFGVSDALRLGRSMKSIGRLVDLGEAEVWECLDRSDGAFTLRATKELIRSRAPEAKTLYVSPLDSQPEENESPSQAVEPPMFTYVDDARLADLRRLESRDFDLRKAIALCEELNMCYRSQCYHAVAALTRALLDHVPPVFGFDTFAEVANNYDGGRSLKACLMRLQGSARDIADMHLHQRIRKKESLPSRTQVDFSSEIDLLLAELVRILEGENGTPSHA